MMRPLYSIFEGNDSSPRIVMMVVVGGGARRACGCELWVGKGSPEAIAKVVVRLRSTDSIWDETVTVIKFENFICSSEQVLK